MYFILKNLAFVYVLFKDLKNYNIKSRYHHAFKQYCRVQDIKRNKPINKETQDFYRGNFWMREKLRVHLSGQSDCSLKVQYLVSNVPFVMLRICVIVLYYLYIMNNLELVVFSGY